MNNDVASSLRIVGSVGGIGVIIFCGWLVFRGEGAAVQSDAAGNGGKGSESRRSLPSSLGVGGVSPRSVRLSEEFRSTLISDFEVTLDSIPRSDAKRYVSRFLGEHLDELTFGEGIELVSGIDDVALYESSLRAVILRLGSQNLDELVAFAGELDSEDAEVWKAVGLALGVASKGKPLPAIVKNSENSSLVNAFMRSIGESGSRGILETVGEVNPTLRDSALGSAIGGLVDDDFDEKTDADFSEAVTLMNSVGAREDRDLAGSNIVVSWLRHDAGAAVRWVDSLAASDAALYVAVVPRCVATWFADDPLACSKWLLTVPEGQARDYGAFNLARLLVRKSPDEARAWASSIGDDNLRAEAEALVAR